MKNANKLPTILNNSYSNALIWDFNTKFKKPHKPEVADSSSALATTKSILTKTLKITSLSAFYWCNHCYNSNYFSSSYNYLKLLKIAKFEAFYCRVVTELKSIKNFFERSTKISFNTPCSIVGLLNKFYKRLIVCL